VEKNLWEQMAKVLFSFTNTDSLIPLEEINTEGKNSWKYLPFYIL